MMGNVNEKGFTIIALLQLILLTIALIRALRIDVVGLLSTFHFLIYTKWSIVLCVMEVML
ncbi:hypothetical protein TEU_03420 [Thermococcus eurythermalis]|uniref:Uncharacterized protein n=1 Tax=Thermococcus eurythermalis TaxID=1505907 RepID=A0A097QSN1_9EURY|nr:hypothetical protein TEU_03420 [Thermococcus eurythermalis]